MKKHMLQGLLAAGVICLAMGCAGAEDMFTDRDLEPAWDAQECVTIALQGDYAECASQDVEIAGSVVTIRDGGTYLISGTLEDGAIVVDAGGSDKVQLVLSGAQVTSREHAPLYVVQADKVFVTTAADTVNTLCNGGSFAALDENNVDAAIFSKDDLTLNGAGRLVVTSPAGHGVVSKDSLVIGGGEYEISCAAHALSGRDDVRIAGGSLSLAAGKDGIHAENDEDAEAGYVYMRDGRLSITAQGDGISASSRLEIAGGSVEISAGGGSANGEKHSSEQWGRFGGGRRPGGRDGMPWAQEQTDMEADSTSMKGLKAAQVSITGGSFRIDSADDAVHANGSAMISGGTFVLASGDDGFHADDTLEITGGEISITQSYEGLEGQHVNVAGGTITLTATDDGINAAGGADGSGMGGRDGRFGRGGMWGSSDGSITVSGGTLHVTASGDGIDANGTLTITGGYTVVCGPTRGDTATLDYDVSATISGGTFIGTGGAGMAQSFSDCLQGVVAVNAGQQRAGTQITLTDAAGSVILTHAPALDYAVVILSTPQIISGQSYALTAGDAAGDVNAW